MKELSEKEALLKAAAYCSNAEHCCSEVEAKLFAWKVPTPNHETIIRKLIAEKFINEERFCRSFINDKFRFNKWGKQKIAQALWKKNIQTDVYNELLKEINEKEYFKTLQTLISEKRKSVKANSEYELNGKLIRFAVSRGFEMNIIQQCIKSSGNAEMD